MGSGTVGSAVGGRAELYQGRYTCAVLITCIIGGTGGLLFGWGRAPGLDAAAGGGLPTAPC
jgi:hypothetical protein